MWGGWRLFRGALWEVEFRGVGGEETQAPGLPACLHPPRPWRGLGPGDPGGGGRMGDTDTSVTPQTQPLHGPPVPCSIPTSPLAPQKPLVLPRQGQRPHNPAAPHEPGKACKASRGHPRVQSTMRNIVGGMTLSKGGARDSGKRGAEGQAQPTGPPAHGPDPQPPIGSQRVPRGPRGNKSFPGGRGDRGAGRAGPTGRPGARLAPGGRSVPGAGGRWVLGPQG